MGLAWPIRSVLAGAAGTAALTAAYAAERRLRRSHVGQLAYDDSLVPGQIVASVMHLPNVTARGDRDLGLALRWGYGSAFGLLHGVLITRVNLPPFIVTLGTLNIAFALTHIYSKDETISDLPSLFVPPAPEPAPDPLDTATDTTAVAAPGDSGGPR